MKTTSGLLATWLFLVSVALALCSCAGVAGGNTGGGSGGNTGGSGGGGGTFSNRHFVSTVYSAGQEVDLVLDSSSTHTFSGSISQPPSGRAAGNAIDGEFNTTTGEFTGQGTYNGGSITLTGTLPSADRGGSAAVNINGVNCRGVFGSMSPNTLYFRRIDTVTDSYYAGNNGELPAGYIEAAGRMNGFTTWGGQPHSAYISALIRESANDPEPANFAANDGSISAGSYLHVTKRPGLYESTPPLGECYFYYTEGGRTYEGVSGYVVIDRLDPATHEMLYHFEALEVQGAGDLWEAPFGFGRFAIDGRFVGNYNESDQVGPF